MPTWIHEWVAAPLAFGLAFVHASRAFGPRRAGVELAALCVYGFALEWVAMAVFGSHRYAGGWMLAPAGVPMAIAAVWAAVIVSAVALSVRAGAGSPWHRAALAASLGITLDLLMEPVAMQVGLWEWTPRGPWLGVPIGNFVGWAVIVGGYALGAERWPGTGALLGDALRRLGLAAAAIAALVAVGIVWKATGAEQLFEGAAGWSAWALLAVAPLMLSWIRTRAVPGVPTFATRLGHAPGMIPALVFAVVATTFLIDAATQGGRELAIVAGGTVAGLLGSAARGRSYLKSFFRLVKAESLGESVSSS